MRINRLTSNKKLKQNRILIFSGGRVVPVTRFKHILLKLHNKYRQMAGASNMNKMVWDDSLSEQAKIWIHHCEFKHKYGPGENLAFDSRVKSIGRYIKDALQQWHEENKGYDYDGKDCHPSGSCHYTQMVWAQTYKVGCAMEICRSMYARGQRVNNAWFLACFYDPKGNDATEYPFLKGKPCSKCKGKQKMKLAHSTARKQLKSNSDYQKRHYDLKAKKRAFKPGDAVWLYDNTRKVGVCQKLTSKWKGPYVVTKQIDDTTYFVRKSLKLPSKAYHIDRLLKYRVIFLNILVLIKTEVIPIDKYKQQLLDLHNDYRSIQHGSDMQELTWSNELAQEAQDWIKSCRFEHQKKGRGENLGFQAMPEQTIEQDVNISVKAWYDEIKSYRYGPHSCGSSCHYTQDDSANCAVWLKAGECARNPNYMNTNCRKSCGRC
ncbi:hypothetical protein KUTeg_016997 [Tegillarca granosa]|uniref:ShKT domain-containing protein n=1 Tax=Tegillarca granosa TaxID=220873 RepID=A0ABQ9ER88_TEGGR|nr:hypothetical protein KUTeg_016997 [Tegillarca granosa]